MRSANSFVVITTKQSRFDSVTSLHKTIESWKKLLASTSPLTKKPTCYEVRIMAFEQSTSIGLPKQYPHEYNCWKSMRGRCYRPSNSSWKYYGAKGIRVCQRWLDSFSCFLEDMGAAPSEQHQIDRLRNEDHYEPGNCHWSTPKEQQANTSKVLFITFRGITLSIADWSDLLDIPSDTLRCRLRFLNWTVDDALMVPVFEQLKKKYRRPVLPKGTNPARTSRAKPTDANFAAESS